MSDLPREEFLLIPRLLMPTTPHTPQGHLPNQADAHLQNLLSRSKQLRASGQEQDAIALGPDILNSYFLQENGYTLPRTAPRTFTEKLYCRMLDVHENGAPLYSRLSDKYQVRAYVAEKAGAQYLTELLWHGSTAAEIPWETLPAKSMLKCREGSGKNLLLTQGMQQQQVKDRCWEWQANPYYWFRREYHYYSVPRQLLIEGILSDAHPDGPIDYIFFCFDGIPRLIQVGSRSHSIHRFFSTDWQPVDLTYRTQFAAPDMPRPAALDEMLQLAAKLSQGFDFVRIDLYGCHGAIQFGEMTFTPRAGNIAFRPSHWNVQLGEYWHYVAPEVQK